MLTCRCCSAPDEVKTAKSPHLFRPVVSIKSAGNEVIGKLTFGVIFGRSEINGLRQFGCCRKGFEGSPWVQPVQTQMERSRSAI